MGTRMGADDRNDIPEERMARSLQERLGHAAGQVSDALTGAGRSWSGAVAQLTRALPDPVTMVDVAFDVAEEVLRTQREATLAVVRFTRRDRR